MDPLMLTLRLVHIVLGSVWVGILVFNTIYLGPTVQELGPDGGKVMAALQRRGLMTLLPVLGLATIVTGVWMLWLVSAGFNAAYFHSPAGHTFAAGGALAIVGYFLGITILRPAMLRAMALGQGMPQVTDEGERAARQQEILVLRTRARRAGQVVATLLVLATAAMAVGRYL